MLNLLGLQAAKPLLWEFPESQLNRAVQSALMEEVCTTPKPGLVDRMDNGAHQDMDFFTFVQSAKAITPYLVEMAKRGFDWSGRLPDLFPEVRTLGVEAEKAMFAATMGVNTHKGAVFSLGIVSAAAGYCLRRSQSVDGEMLLLTAGKMTRRAMTEEFARMKKRPPASYGEELFQKYGEKGIRGEAQRGFPAVRLVSLPVMRRCRRQGLDRNKTNINVLLFLMSAVNDTNILHRSNWKELERVKEKAVQVLSVGGAFTEEGWRAVADWNQEMIAKNISPGGCADLLAVTVFCDLLETGG